MEMIAGFIDRIVKAPEDEKLAARIREEVRELTGRFPLYPSLKRISA